MIENLFSKKKKSSRQKLLQDLTFSAFSKVQKWTSNIVRTPETKQNAQLDVLMFQTFVIFKQKESLQVKKSNKILKIVHF